MAVRGRDEWNYDKMDEMDLPGDENFRITTNVNKSRVAANHTRPRWVSMFGVVNNQRMNLTVIPYSNNHNLPEMVRVHPEMPYFSFTPVVTEEHTIEPGATFKSEYRIVTSNDSLSSSQIKSVLSLW